MPGVHWNINWVHWLAYSSTKCPLSATQWQGCFLISDVKACNIGYLKKASSKSGGRHWRQNIRKRSCFLCALLLDLISWMRYFHYCMWGFVWGGWMEVNHLWKTTMQNWISMNYIDAAKFGTWVCYLTTPQVFANFQMNAIISQVAKSWMIVFQVGELRWLLFPLKSEWISFHMVLLANYKTIWSNNLVFLVYYNVQGIVVTHDITNDIAGVSRCSCRWVSNYFASHFSSLLKCAINMYFRVAYAPKLLNATSQRLFCFRTGTTPPPVWKSN